MFTAIVTTAVLLLIIVVAASVIMFRTAFVRDSEKNKFVMKHGADKEWDKLRKSINEATETLKAFPHEMIYTTSKDGLKLAGYYFPCEDAVSTVICAHGFKSTGFWDFSAFAIFMIKNSFNVLLICERACSASEGKYIGYGITERYDILSWVQRINEVNGADEDIVLAGISMGCSTVLMASGLKLPENVKAIIADCGYTRPCDILKNALKKTFHLPPFPIYNIAKLFLRLSAKINIEEYSTLDALKTNKIPVFFVHGGSDAFVPKEMTLNNYEAAVCEKEIFIAEGADHGQSFIKAQNEYIARMSAFLNKAGITL